MGEYEVELRQIEVPEKTSKGYINYEQKIPSKEPSRTATPKTIERPPRIEAEKKYTEGIKKQDIDSFSATLSKVTIFII